MKSMFLTIVALGAILSASAGENQVASSQTQYIAKYENQANVPVPADMLLNTDPEPALTDGFVPLFNGKTLDGWTPRGGHCAFSVTNNAIVGVCVPGSPSTYLSTDKTFSNFIFTCEVKWLVDGNSGVMFRAQSKPGEKNEIVFGPQAEMEGFKTGRGWSGGIYGQSAGGWSYPLWLEAHNEVREALKEGEWNRLTIQAEGETVKTWLNGVPAAHWKTDKYLEGFFSLQVHSGGKGEIHFRNINVKEL